MTSLEKYRNEVKAQIENGIDFNKDVWTVSLSVASEMAEAAKKYGYRRPKTSYFGPGKSFYLCLQRVYKQMKARGEV